MSLPFLICLFRFNTKVFIEFRLPDIKWKDNDSLVADQAQSGMTMIVWNLSRPDTEWNDNDSLEPEWNDNDSLVPDEVVGF